jgi:hypothetical protein
VAYKQIAEVNLRVSILQQRNMNHRSTAEVRAQGEKELAFPERESQVNRNGYGWCSARHLPTTSAEALRHTVRMQRNQIRRRLRNYGRAQQQTQKSEPGW